MSPPTMASMVDDVAREYGVTTQELRHAGRLRRLLRPRRDFMHRARAAGFSTTQIGRYLGGKAHMTVIRGSRAHAERANVETLRERVAEALRLSATQGMAEVVLELRDCIAVMNVFDEWFTGK